VSTVPPYRPLRHVVREVRDVAGGTTPRHIRLRRRLVEIVLSIVVVDAAGTFLMLMFEHNAHGSEITNVGDALFWTTAQLLTVSSQMKNPVTTGGRVVDIVLMAFAITVVASLAGSFGSFFRHADVEAARAEK
jgi:voltage-gated potassium channel